MYIEYIFGSESFFEQKDIFDGVLIHMRELFITSIDGILFYLVNRFKIVKMPIKPHFKI